MNKKLIFLPIIIVVLLLSACAPNDLKDSVYVPAIYPNSNNTGNVGKAGSQWNNGYFKNLYVNGQAVSSSASSSSGLTNPLTSDLDFAKYKAVAMAADNGATLPASPVVGQWFLHTPTGRKILYQYDGASWQPIQSFGTMTVYVDKTNGTDDLSHGTATTTNAFKTIQYAVDAIPADHAIVTIYLSAETYSENVTISGHPVDEAHTIYFIGGTLSSLASLTASGNGVKGATTNRSTFVDNVPMTPNAYQYKLFKFTSGANNGLYRIINSNDATTLTLDGTTLTAQPVTNDTGTVYEWGTVLSGVVNFKNAQVDFSYINFTTGMGASYGHTNFTACKLKVYNAYDYMTLTAYNTAFVNASATPLTMGHVAIILIEGCQVAGPAAGFGIQLGDMALLLLNGGTSISNITYGIEATHHAQVTCAAVDVYVTIENATYGIIVKTNSNAVGTGVINFITVTSSKYAESATYSYID